MVQGARHRRRGGHRQGDQAEALRISPETMPAPLGVSSSTDVFLHHHRHHACSSFAWDPTATKRYRQDRNKNKS